MPFVQQCHIILLWFLLRTISQWRSGLKLSNVPLHTREKIAVSHTPNQFRNKSNMKCIQFISTEECPKEEEKNEEMIAVKREWKRTNWYKNRIAWHSYIHFELCTNMHKMIFSYFRFIAVFELKNFLTHVYVPHTIRVLAIINISLQYEMEWNGKSPPPLSSIPRSSPFGSVHVKVCICYTKFFSSDMETMSCGSESILKKIH